MPGAAFQRSTSSLRAVFVRRNFVAPCHEIRARGPKVPERGRPHLHPHWVVALVINRAIGAHGGVAPARFVGLMNYLRAMLGCDQRIVRLWIAFVPLFRTDSLLR